MYRARGLTYRRTVVIARNAKITTSPATWMSKAYMTTIRISS